MELVDFIEKFAEQFEDTEMSEFTADTVFKDLDEWSSLIVLSLIAMVDTEYNARVTAEDFRNTETIKDLFDLVKTRI